jgi:hypothetical protein
MERGLESIGLWAVMIGCNCNRSASKSNYPIQSPLLFFTEPRTHDIVFSVLSERPMGNDGGWWPIRVNEDSLWWSKKHVPLKRQQQYQHPHGTQKKNNNIIVLFLSISVLFESSSFFSFPESMWKTFINPCSVGFFILSCFIYIF